LAQFHGSKKDPVVESDDKGTVPSFQDFFEIASLSLDLSFPGPGAVARNPTRNGL